jgi:hypothetical protein
MAEYTKEMNQLSTINQAMLTHPVLIGVQMMIELATHPTATHTLLINKHLPPLVLLQVIRTQWNTVPATSFK